MSKEKFSHFFIEENRLRQFVIIFLLIVVILWIRIGLMSGFFCLIFTMKDFIFLVFELIFLFFSINKTIESFVIIVSLTRIVEYVVTNKLIEK